MTQLFPDILFSEKRGFQAWAHSIRDQLHHEWISNLPFKLSHSVIECMSSIPAFGCEPQLLVKDGLNNWAPVTHVGVLDCVPSFIHQPCLLIVGTWELRVIWYFPVIPPLPLSLLYFLPLLPHPLLFPLCFCCCDFGHHHHCNKYLAIPKILSWRIYFGEKNKYYSHWWNSCLSLLVADDRHMRKRTFKGHRCTMWLQTCMINSNKLPQWQSSPEPWEITQWFIFFLFSF